MNREDKIKLAKAIYTKKIRRLIDPLKYFTPIDEKELNQKAFIESKKRNLNAFGGNRSGKTKSGAVKVIKHCRENANTDCWAATWADMSIPVQQKEYYNLLPKNEVKFANFTEQRGFLHKIIIFRNGSKIRFKSYEQGWESFQGASKHLIHLDEEPPQDIVNECKARLIDYNGQLIRTMTPLNGITYTYDEVIVNPNRDTEIEYYFFNTDYNPYVSNEARERIFSGYADKEREVRNKGHFLNLTSGQVYYAFDNEANIAEWKYNPNLPLEVSCDFNVSLMYWPISQEMRGRDFEFDYVELLDHANTDLMCQMLKSKYPEHKPDQWIFYGDISGSKRDPATSLSSWGIIQNHFPKASIFYQNIRNIKDRTDSVNGRLHNKQGRFLYVSNNLTRLKLDLMRVTWEMLLNKGKAGLLTHASDALSYKIFKKYPLYGLTQSRGGLQI